MPTRTFTVAQLEELIPRPHHENVLANIEGEAHRWYTVRHLVFEHEGKLWQVDYCDPASEDQEGQARWSMDTDDAPDAEVAAIEVRKTVKVFDWWEPVAEPEPAADGDGRAMSLPDLLGKIEWEGSIPDALAYGLKPEDLSADARASFPEVAAVWDAMFAAYQPFDELMDRWQKLVEPFEIEGEE
jgi:hypothetical protein